MRKWRKALSCILIVCMMAGSISLPQMQTVAQAEPVSGNTISGNDAVSDNTAKKESSITLTNYRKTGGEAFSILYGETLPTPEFTYENPEITDIA